MTCWFNKIAAKRRVIGQMPRLFSHHYVPLLSFIVAQVIASKPSWVLDAVYFVEIRVPPQYLLTNYLTVKDFCR
jgi:hypothetical protein